MDVPLSNGSHPACFIILEQTNVFDANFQKELLLEYKRKFKNKSQEYAKFLVDKRALNRILFGQWDEETKTEIALEATYAADRQARRLSAFTKQMRTVCFGSDDGGLSYGPYKQNVAIKSLDTYTNNESYDSHGFKEQVKIKYEATKAIAEKSPNGTAVLMELLKNAQPAALDWDAYCALPEAN